MLIGVCQFHLRLPGCASLKDKRGRLKPLLARLRREFNVAAAEVDQQDVWQSAVIAVAVISTSAAHAQAELQTIAAWVEHERLEVEVIDAQFEMR